MMMTREGWWTQIVADVVIGWSHSCAQRSAVWSVLFDLAGEASRIAYEESAALMLHMLRLKLLFIKTLRLAVSGSKHVSSLA